MLKRFGRAPRYSVLTVLFICLPPLDLSAQLHHRQGQSDPQKKMQPLRQLSRYRIQSLFRTERHSP
jgi:hypothetical protein